MVSGVKKLTKFAEKISSKMVDRGIVSKEDAGLYRYGIESGITVAGNLLASILFGIMIGRLGMVLVFLLFYGTLRTYSGGVHCKSKLGCFVLSLLILLVPVFSYEWVMEMVIFPLLFVVGIIAIAIVLVLSPVESDNKPLENEERKYCRRISHCIAALQGCAIVFLYCMEIYEYFYAGYCSILLVAIFMIFGKINTKHYI